MIITDSKKHESKDLHIIAIVAIVGIVAIVLGFFANNKNGPSDLFAEENLVGQASDEFVWNANLGNVNCNALQKLIFTLLKQYNDKSCDEKDNNFCNLLRSRILTLMQYYKYNCQNEIGYCGDGIINNNEVCDGGNLGGQTCQSQGYDYGSMSCCDDCSRFRFSSCYEITSRTCTDGDGNLTLEESFYVASTTSSSSSFSPGPACPGEYQPSGGGGGGGGKDSCSASILTELICNKDNTTGSIEYECPNGCKDGACILENCTTPFDGMVITEDTTFCSGTYNLPNGIEIGTDNVELDCNGAVLDGNEGDFGIISNSKDNNIIKNCIIKNYGISLELSFGSDQNKIINNIIKDNNYGIELLASNNNNLFNNTIKNNSGYGIILSRLNSIGVTNNKIHNNIINKNYRGIDLLASKNNSIRYNQINENEIFGLSLRFGSINNLIENNNMYNNSNFNLDNNQGENATAELNYWGTVNISEIESKIKGDVDFCPFLSAPYPFGDPIFC